MPTQVEVEQQILILSARGHAVRTAGPVDIQGRLARLQEALEVAQEWLQYPRPSRVSGDAWSRLQETYQRQLHSHRAETAVAREGSDTALVDEGGKFTGERSPRAMYQPGSTTRTALKLMGVGIGAYALWKLVQWRRKGDQR